MGLSDKANENRSDRVSTTTTATCYTLGDSDVISMPAIAFAAILWVKLINVYFSSGIDEIRFVGKLAIIQTLPTDWVLFK